MLEYILVFRKPGEKRMYVGRTMKEKKRDAMNVDAVFTRDIANNIWHIAPVPPNQLPHPCPYPEELAYRLIRLFSYTGDLVLDPFAGIGTTLKVAEWAKRNWVGYELKKEYIRYAKKRIPQPVTLRKQLIAEFAKIEYGEEMAAKNKGRAPFRREKKVSARRDDATN